MVTSNVVIQLGEQSVFYKARTEGTEECFAYNDSCHWDTRVCLVTACIIWPHQRFKERQSINIRTSFRKVYLADRAKPGAALQTPPSFIH